MREVRRYLDLEHFDVEVIATKNSAAGGLCAWVQNIVNCEGSGAWVRLRALSAADAPRRARRLRRG